MTTLSCDPISNLEMYLKNGDILGLVQFSLSLKKFRTWAGGLGQLLKARLTTKKFRPMCFLSQTFPCHTQQKEGTILFLAEWVT